MMTKEEFEMNYYTDFPIYHKLYKNDKIRINGILMYNSIYCFDIIIIDNVNHYKVLSMTSPEILYEYEDDYKLTKEDVDELMYVLEQNNGWNLIIESMKNCIQGDQLEGTELDVDFNNIPTTPPNYRLLVD